MTWVNPFNNAQIPTTTQSVVTYNFNDVRIPGQQVIFPLTWAWTEGINPIAYNTILSDNGRTDEAESIVMMPPVASGSVGFATFMTNQSTTNAITMQDNAGNNLGQLPAQACIQLVLLNTSVEDTSSWAVIPMNVPIQTITNPVSVAGQGLAVSDEDQLYVEYVYTELNLANYTNNTYTLPSWNANFLYVFRYTSGTVILPSAAGSDTGKTNIFKNLTNGTITIQVPTDSLYQIDINIILQGSTVIGGGLTSIILLPNEAVGLSYSGQITLVNTTTAFLYTIVTQVNTSSALVQQATLYLPQTPPSPSPQALDINIVTADVIFITDANQAAPASGSYTFFVQYPVAKIYYFAMEVVNNEVDIPTVTISFGNSNPSNQISISPLTGLVQCYVATDGTVIIANINSSSLPFATQQQAIAGVSTSTIISPATLAGVLDYYYTDISDTSAGVPFSGVLTLGDIVDTLTAGSVTIGGRVNGALQQLYTVNAAIGGHIPYSTARTNVSDDGSYTLADMFSTNNVSGSSSLIKSSYSANGTGTFKPYNIISVQNPDGSSSSSVMAANAQSGTHGFSCYNTTTSSNATYCAEQIYPDSSNNASSGYFLGNGSGHNTGWQLTWTNRLSLLGILLGMGALGTTGSSVTAFADFIFQQVGANFYQVIPSPSGGSGIIIQMGTGTIPYNTFSTTVTLPIAFPTTAYTALAIDSSDAGSPYLIQTASFVGISQLLVVANGAAPTNPGGNSFNWLAIGE